MNKLLALTGWLLIARAAHSEQIACKQYLQIPPASRVQLGIGLDRYGYLPSELIDVVISATNRNGEKSIGPDLADRSKLSLEILAPDGTHNQDGFGKSYHSGIDFSQDRASTCQIVVKQFPTGTRSELRLPSLVGGGLGEPAHFEPRIRAPEPPGKYRLRAHIGLTAIDVDFVVLDPSLKSFSVASSNLWQPGEAEPGRGNLRCLTFYEFSVGQELIIAADALAAPCDAKTLAFRRMNHAVLQGLDDPASRGAILRIDNLEQGFRFPSQGMHGFQMQRGRAVSNANESPNREVDVLLKALQATIQNRDR